MVPRLPRFNRAPAVAPIELTERDREIIRLVYRHRFLRSPQIAALVGGSPQQILRRLQSLYHHGYLERPRAQIDYYHRGGSRHIVYGLGNEGGLLLEQEFGVTLRELSWAEKNRGVGRVFLEHTLLISDIMATIELACRKANIRLLTEREIALPRESSEKHQPFNWKVKLKSGVRLGVIPDRVFALEFLGEDGQNQHAYFFLEADRGTMPVKRHTLSQTSFYRKLLAYEATWSQSIHRTCFGFHRFRVLTVTTSPKRVQSLIDACSQLERGHGLFLFADRTVLARPEDIFSTAWQTGKPGETGSLLD